MTAPITDEELARLEDDVANLRSFKHHESVPGLIARLRAVEARAKKAEEERDEARAANESECSVSYAKGRADDRAEVIAEVDRAIRMYEHAGAPDEVRALTAVRDDIATLTHFTGKGG